MRPQTHGLQLRIAGYALCGISIEQVWRDDMAEQRTDEHDYGVHEDRTFERHGPEPPENDSGPSPSVEERERATNRRAPASNVSNSPFQRKSREQ